MTDQDSAPADNDDGPAALAAQLAAAVRDAFPPGTLRDVEPWTVTELLDAGADR